MPAHDVSAAFPAMAYCRNGLDRGGNSRSDKQYVESLRTLAEARLLRLSGDRTPLDGTGSPAVAIGPAPDGSLFLGADEAQRPWFAAAVADEPGFLDLRSIAVSGRAPAEMLGRLAQARSLLQWHERHGFCANCGHATEVADAGYRRICSACKAEHYPRTDPVIIIAVRRHGQLLLGRQAMWKEGMFSTLAGFMEPGETIEDAARREVEEESGIRLGEVRYVANQPWPFPSSLMIGLIGEALNDDITVDPKELETAHWFSAEEIIAMRAGTHPGGLVIPPPLAIAHRLILTAINP